MAILVVLCVFPTVNCANVQKNGRLFGKKLLTLQFIRSEPRLTPPLNVRNQIKTKIKNGTRRCF